MYTRKESIMNQSTISKPIQKLYHIRKNDLQALLHDLPYGTEITVHSIQEEFPWKADNVFMIMG